MSEKKSKQIEEISFHELVRFARRWLTYVSKHMFKLILFVLLGGLIGYLWAHNKKTLYEAKITLIVEEGKSSTSGLGSLSSIAGQFGVDLSSGGSSNVLSGENILLYFKSPSLAREVLLSKLVQNDNLTVADAYIKSYGLFTEWSSNPKIGKVKFNPLSDTTIYTRIQDSLMKVIIEKILVQNFNISKTDKKSSFIDVTTTMSDEYLAKIYCEKIVQRVSERYIDLKVKRYSESIERLKNRLDSIELVLTNKTFKTSLLQNSATTMDINPLYKFNNDINIETISRDKSILSSLYAATIQNLEASKFALNQEIPIIQIIDKPILPLKAKRPSLLVYSLIGSFISFLFTLIVLSTRFYFSSLKFNK